jgi:GT2 family glycosyltransferase
MVPRWLPLARMTEWSHDSDRNVGQVMGAFFLVRGSLCVALDGFDERFFLYFEEVDFSLREAQRGWTSAYLVGASAYHEGGGAFRAALSLRLYHSIRSRILFARKHFARHEAALVLATTLLVEPIARTVRSFAMLSIGRLVLELAAFARFAYGIPALLRVRRVP